MNSDNYKSRNNERMIYVVKFSSIFLFTFFYILIPPLLHSFDKSRILIIVLTAIVFIFYGILRYFIIRAFFDKDRKIVSRFLVDIGSLVIGLTLLYILEGFIYNGEGNYSIPSYRFLLDFIAFSFLAPTLYTNSIIFKLIKTGK